MEQVQSLDILQQSESKIKRKPRKRPVIEVKPGKIIMF